MCCSVPSRFWFCFWVQPFSRLFCFLMPLVPFSPWPLKNCFMLATCALLSAVYIWVYSTVHGCFADLPQQPGLPWCSSSVRCFLKLHPFHLHFPAFQYIILFGTLVPFHQHFGLLCTVNDGFPRGFGLLHVLFPITLCCLRRPLHADFNRVLPWICTSALCWLLSPSPVSNLVLGN